LSDSIVTVCGRPLKRGELAYNPTAELREHVPCAACYNVWRKERGVPRGYRYWFAFVRYFNEVCRRKRAKREVVTWEDFDGLTPEELLKRCLRKEPGEAKLTEWLAPN
jgi:hypothetical protein